MRDISQNLKNEILNGTIANCIKVESVMGDLVFGYTDHEKELIVDGVNYVPAPGLQKIKMNNQTGTSVSNTELGSAWVDVPEEYLSAGYFDLAKVTLYWVSWEHPEYGGHIAYKGTINSLTYSESGFSADIVSDMKKLEKLFSLFFTANCRHILYGGPEIGGAAYCGVLKQNFSYPCTVTSVVSTTVYGISGASSTANMFKRGYGKIVSASHPLAGTNFAIKNVESGLMELMIEIGSPLEVGTDIIIYAGCDKTLATCKNVFNNVINFGGFPHIKPQVNFK